MSSATQVLIDRIRHERGELSMDDLRANYRAGKYPTQGEMGRLAQIVTPNNIGGMKP